jgi:hypothetical protein
VELGRSFGRSRPPLGGGAMCPLFGGRFRAVTRSAARLAVSAFGIREGSRRLGRRERRSAQGFRSVRRRSLIGSGTGDGGSGPSTQSPVFGSWTGPLCRTHGYSSSRAGKLRSGDGRAELPGLHLAPPRRPKAGCDTTARSVTTIEAASVLLSPRANALVRVIGGVRAAAPEAQLPRPRPEGQPLQQCGVPTPATLVEVRRSGTDASSSGRRRSSGWRR